MYEIYYHMKEPAVRVLGPGTRYVLWVQGCLKRCPGCIAGNTRRMEDGKVITAGALAWEIALSGAEGLTISGGEPFLQAVALAELVRQVHRIRTMGVIVYSGYRLEELEKINGGAEFLSLIDLLIDGEYIQQLNDGLGLRGSSNQRVIDLTGLYREFLPGYVNRPRKQEVFCHGAEIHEVGLPDRQGNYHTEEDFSS